MTAEARERLQVGLDAGAAAGVRRGDGETARWCQRPPFAGTNRIRFSGCDLSPVGAPRFAEPSKCVVGPTAGLTTTEELYGTPTLRIAEGLTCHPFANDYDW